MNTWRIHFGAAAPRRHFRIYRFGDWKAEGFVPRGSVRVDEDPHKYHGEYATLDDAIAAVETLGGTWEVFPKEPRGETHIVADF